MFFFLIFSKALAELVNVIEEYGEHKGCFAHGFPEIKDAKSSVSFGSIFCQQLWLANSISAKLSRA